MQLRRRELAHLLDPESFLWLAGIEDTFITAQSPRTGRTLDEYELTGHYERASADIALFADLGLQTVRYGIPWHRINPTRNQWDFDWCDRAVDRLLELGIEPIVDLVHYGTPTWIDDAFLHPDFDRYMAEYATRVAERYRGRIHAYTPLNEPRITAWYCGRLGWWPPYRRSWSGFLAVLLAVCRGIVRTATALRAVDDDIVLVHVDATDLYEAESPDLESEATLRQAIVFLALDLVSGRVDENHALHAWALQRGASVRELDRFREAPLDLEIVGLNLYPLFSLKQLVRSRGKLRIRMPYAGAEIVERLVQQYAARYACPLFISETASSGSIARRLAWLEDSVAAVRSMREQGVPLVGYTWWPLFSLVTWGYREGRLDPAAYLRHMGLWDLEQRPDGLARVQTAIADRYRELVAGGTAAVGRLEVAHVS